MPTKAELEQKIEDLEHDIRRLNRSINQTRLDLEDLPTNAFKKNFPTPQLSEQTRQAIDRAHGELDQVVIDPCDRINTYIKSKEGIGWSWESDYIKNGQFAWCGAFAAYCYTAVSFPIRNKIFPSCYRMYKAWSQTSRCIDHAKVQPGDVVVVYSSKRAIQGDHITLCIDNSTISEGYITTIEGNAHGTLGNGERGEGVITRQRKLSEFAHVYRLLNEDFDEH
jgi:hypothetical protein